MQSKRSLQEELDRKLCSLADGLNARFGQEKLSYSFLATSMHYLVQVRLCNTLLVIGNWHFNIISHVNTLVNTLV